MASSKWLESRNNLSDQSLCAVAFNHAGSTIVGGAGKQLVLIDTLRDRPRVQLDVGAVVADVQSSRNGDFVAVALHDTGSANVYVSDTLELAVALKHSMRETVSYVRMPPTEHKLLSIAADVTTAARTVRLWDLVREQTLLSHSFDTKTNTATACAQFAGSSGTIAVADHLIQLIDSRTKSATFDSVIGAIDVPIKHSITGLFISPVRSHVLLALCPADQRVYCCDLRMNAYTDFLSIDSSVTAPCCALSESGRIFTVFGERQHTVFDLVNGYTGRPKRVASCMAQSGLTAIALSSLDDTIVAGVSTKGDVLGYRICAMEEAEQDFGGPAELVHWKQLFQRRFVLTKPAPNQGVCMLS
eukprot:TRINITY_DN9274_c0_g1_i1.p1 TRINITY_DN9274_c0_g1~~TRINITY_DN9274_c0_g1_i1.p1  ORF type:complete len:358 (+),score=76.77 TRINITY_DN9274_c0_g1_i1:19-1092(+)